MTSEALRKARDFEAQYGPHIPAQERPAFHRSEERRVGKECP